MPYWCYHCNRVRSACPPGLEDGGCALVEEAAAEYRADKEAGKYNTPAFTGMVRLRNQNAEGLTANEITKEITDTAKREGREIQRKR